MSLLRAMQGTAHQNRPSGPRPMPYLGVLAEHVWGTHPAGKRPSTLTLLLLALLPSFEKSQRHRRRVRFRQAAREQRTDIGIKLLRAG